MNINPVNSPVAQVKNEKNDLKKSEKNLNKAEKKAEKDATKEVKNNSIDKDVKFEKVDEKKTLETYGKEAADKYAVNIGVVEEMKKALDQKMEKSFLQMAIDTLGEHQVGIKNALEEILKSKESEITDEMIEEAKEDVSEDGYYGVEATAQRMVDFAKALSGGNPAKAELLRNAFLDAYDQATEAWGDELPEISKKTKERTIELFDEWENKPEDLNGDEVAVEAPKET